MRYSFQDRPVSKFGPPIWNCDKSLVARRARSAISDCLVSLCNISVCWVQEPHQTKITCVVDHLLAWHSWFNILTSPRACFQMTTGAQRTVSSAVAVPWVPWLEHPIMVCRRISTSLGLWDPQCKTCCRSHLVGKFHTPAMCLQAWRPCTCTFPESAIPIMAKLGSKLSSGG